MIEVRELQKTFKLYQRPSDRLKEILFRRSFHTRYEALRGVSFRVEDGETLAALRNMGVDYAQGFVVSRARPPKDLLLASSMMDLLVSEEARNFVRRTTA